MGWRSGEKVLQAYNHFFQPAGHATVQDSVFEKLQKSAPKPVETPQPGPEVATPHSSPASQASTQTQVPSQDGAALYAFLIGKGGEIDDLIADLITSD